MVLEWWWWWCSSFCFRVTIASYVQSCWVRYICMALNVAIRIRVKYPYFSLNPSWERLYSYIWAIFFVIDIITFFFFFVIIFGLIMWLEHATSGFQHWEPFKWATCSLSLSGCGWVVGWLPHRPVMFGSLFWTWNRGFWFCFPSCFGGAFSLICTLWILFLLFFGQLLLDLGTLLGPCPWCAAE